MGELLLEIDSLATKLGVSISEENADVHANFFFFQSTDRSQQQVGHTTIL